MYLVFDTETTSLPKDYKAPVTDSDNWPRMVSLSWEMHTSNGVLVDKSHRIIKPVGFTIPEAASRIHGITTEQAIEKGFDLGLTLEIFYQAVSMSSLLVAHNVAFDEKIVGAEFYRSGLITNSLNEIEKYCTMTAGIYVCRIPGYKRGTYKWPKLDELYRHLFREGFDGAHNSQADTAACARCFFEMKRLSAK